MTEREKIIEIIKRNGTYNGKSLSFDYYVIQPDELADALFAAGIVVDVQSLANGNCVLYVKGKGFMRLYNEQDINEMIQRVEVAERALDKACEDIEQLMDYCRWAADGGVITIKEYTPENATPQAYIERSEKERRSEQ